MSDTAIKIWSRDTLPPEYRPILDRFDKDDDDILGGGKTEVAMMVVHIPARMLADRLMQTYFDVGKLSTDKRYIVDRFYDPLYRLFGTNALNRVEHPSGDGFFLICSQV
jgi:hypothetical protein